MTDKQKSKITLMTEGNIFKILLFFAIPLVLGNLLQQMYSTVDSIIVGNYVGSQALAAVSSSSMVVTVIISGCQGIAVGAGVVIAQCLGAKNRRNVFRSVHTSLAFSIVLGVILTVFCALLTKPIVESMNTPKDILDDSITYLFIYSFGLIFTIVYNMIAGILNASGNSKRSLLYLAYASVINVVLDLLFILVFNMGVAGAAIATNISQLIACLMSLNYVMTTKNECRVYLKAIRFHKQMLVRILRMGIPAGIQNTVICFSNVLIQASVNVFGYETITGFGIYLKIDGFDILPLLSISLAVATFVGQNYVAGCVERIRKGIICGLILGVTFTAGIGIAMLIFYNPILRLFTSDEKAIYYAYLSILYFCPFYALVGVTQVFAGAIRGAGRSMVPMMVLLFSFFIFRIIWIMFVLPNFNSFEGVLLVYPVSWFVSANLMTLCYIKLRKKILRVAKIG
ncbi:MAG: MATE family efflux transporter [Succinivibrio sp.]|nr:MATE family efflux transporter [Succinivibrio sp.]